jgi:hypothetical protein
VTTRRAPTEPCAAGLTRWLLLAVALAASGCESRSGQPSEGETAAVPETETFHFGAVGGLSPIELPGAGSEVLLAPPGTEVSAVESGFALRAGADFAIDVAPAAPQLAEIEARLSPSDVVVKQEDLLVYGRAGAYRFAVVRQLVPEWDEDDRRRFSCASAGALSLRADAPAFPRAAVERMVAACRALELPRLE